MPKKVRTLVDLEALLNDGTAYVLFVLLKVGPLSMLIACLLLSYSEDQGSHSHLPLVRRLPLSH